MDISTHSYWTYGLQRRIIVAMKTFPTHDLSVRRFPALVAVRDELRERRRVRAEYRSLERDLVSYTSRSDVDDLLAALGGQTGVEAEQIREILTRNLQTRPRNLIAS